MLRRLSRDVLFYGAGDVLVRTSAFVTLPIFTRVFTPEEYGVLNVVTTTVGIFGIIVGLGGESTLARFFFSATDYTERQVITSTWVMFLVLWSVGLTLLGLVLIDRLSQWSFETNTYRWLFGLALLAVPITLINSLCGQVLRNQFKVSQFVALNIVAAFLSVGLSLFAVLVLKLGLAGILGGALVGAALMLPWRLWTARDLLRIRFSKKILSACIRYGASLVTAGLAYWVFTFSDRLLLAKLGTLNEVGLYSVAAMLVSPMVVLLGAFSQAWSPHAFQIFETAPELASAFFGRVATYLLVGFGLVGVGLTTFSQELLKILSSSSFASASVVVAPLTLGAIAYATTQVTAVAMSLTKRTKYLGICAWLAACVNAGLNLVLIPRFGMVGSAWATACALTFLTLSYCVISQRLWLIAFEHHRVLAATVVTAVFICSAQFLPQLSLLLNLLLKGIYVLGYVIVLILSGAVDSRELVAMQSIHSIRSFIHST